MGIRYARRWRPIVVGLAAVVAVAACGGVPSAPPATESPVASEEPGAPRSVAPSDAPAASASLPAPIAGDSVPTYRGDAARTGEMPGPAPSGEPTIAWQFDVEGSALSNSPVVADGTVYVAGVDGVVRAIDLATGGERWKVTIPFRVSATPVIVGDVLVVGDEMGSVYGLTRADGSTIWTNAIGGGITGSPPAVDDDILVATLSGALHRIVAATGEESSEPLDVGSGVTRSVAVGDGMAYLGIGGDLVAVDIETWTERWRSHVAGAGEIGTPTVAGELVYAATGLGGESADAYGVVAVDTATGEVAWRYASPTQASIYTPAVSDGRAFIIGHDRLMVALDARTGAEAWSIDLERDLEALPSVVDGVVFTVGNDGPAVAVDAADGSILWEVPTVGIPFAPTIVHGYLLVGTSAGILYAIGGS